MTEMRVRCPKCDSDDTMPLNVTTSFCFTCEHRWLTPINPVSGSPKQIKRERQKDFQTECECCGQVFCASRYDARFCSPQCRLKAHRDSKKTPAYLLRDNPLEMARYRLLKEISPSSAETVALYMRRLSLKHGLEVLQACIAVAMTSNEQYRLAFAEIAKEYQAARNGLAKQGGAV